jgi:selenocysteine lyase/cysteine desulfurase
MTGTPNFEGIAGVLAAVDYLAGLSQTIPTRRRALQAAFDAIAEHERELAKQFLQGLRRLPDIRLWGIADPARLAERVPTFSITHSRLPALQVAEQLARRGIFVWHGNFYALALTEALGLEPHGMVRIGLLHYNTSAEVDRLLKELGELH